MGTASRDIDVYEDARAAPGPGGRSVIAVIGIDRYAAWPRLSNAVSDARGALEIFEQLGFAPAAPPLFDEHASGPAINALVKDELSKLSEQDRLVVFYAGHGHTITRRLDNLTVRTGFLILVNAEGAGGRPSSWIRLDTWLSDVARLPPRHILVIVDACRSGIALGQPSPSTARPPSRSWNRWPSSARGAAGGSSRGTRRPASDGRSHRPRTPTSFRSTRSRGRSSILGASQTTLRSISRRGRQSRRIKVRVPR